MRIIGLLLTILLLVTPLAAQAQGITWPSLSPSYHCYGGLSVFVIANVGTDMQAGSQYTVSTPTRIVERGVFWIAAGQDTEWWYNAPGIPLTFAYQRPDNGQWVQMTQTCGVAATGETPVDEPETRCYSHGCDGVHMLFAPIMVTP